MRSVKKLVSCSMFGLGFARLAFSFSQHMAGHHIKLIEVIEALPFLTAGALLYATNTHKILVSISQTVYKIFELRGIDALNYSIANFFRRLSQLMYKIVELRGIDALNYSIAKITTSFSKQFRKSQTGVLSYNMIAVLGGMVLLLTILIIFGV